MQEILAHLRALIKPLQESGHFSEELRQVETVVECLMEIGEFQTRLDAMNLELCSISKKLVSIRNNTNTGQSAEQHLKALNGMGVLLTRKIELEPIVQKLFNDGPRLLDRLVTLIIPVINSPLNAAGILLLKEMKANLTPAQLQKLNASCPGAKPHLN